MTVLKFDIITLFPQLFTAHLDTLPLKRAISQNAAKVNLWNLRDYAVDNYGSVDDKPYGGGTGMILMVEPVFKVLNDIYKSDGLPQKLPENSKIIALSPRGKKYTQKTAKELSKCDQITLICGRYEGMDARIEENLATDIVSIGDFVLSGGETAALAIMESVARLLPGVLEKEDATIQESFYNGYLEYPQYTRPENFRNMKVPNVLLSGNHQEIEKWRKGHMKKVGESSN